MADMYLVYGEGRTFMVQQRIPETVKQLMGDAAKAYFKGHYRASRGDWDIGERVQDRHW